jgi:hypothetical protein
MYGLGSVQFLGQNPKSDLAAEYYGTSTFDEYLHQLTRWESEFRKLINLHPELEAACHLANRVERPDNWKDMILYLENHYPDIPVAEKILFYFLLQGVRKLVTFNKFAQHWGQGGNWVSPKSDRR